ncbi:MAG TPA: DUF4340 domain-containing protein [Leptospiraceae bacterium]|nr:DUF4340 domain-containing protein [Leptospiraceae bacterium]
MNSIWSKVKSNPGLSLLSANVVLLAVIVLMQDPFGLFKTGYAGARVLLSASQDSISTIEVESPDKPGILRITRKDKLPVKKGEAPEYTWDVERTDGTKTTRMSADRDRVKELFASLEKTRRYYGIARNSESEKDAEMATDSKGRLQCLQVRMISASGKKNTVYVGKSSLRGNDSYVRLDDEDSIYLVEENLRTAFGSGDLEYFRNRRVFPDMSKDDITGITASATGRPLQIARNGQGWQMLSPVPGNVNGSEMNLLLGDFVEWKAVSFPTEIPKDIDKKKSLKVEVQFKTTMTEPRTFAFEVLGQKDFSSYIIRTADGNLFEVTSIYLSHLLEPEEKLLERAEKR